MRKLLARPYGPHWLDRYHVDPDDRHHALRALGDLPKDFQRLMLRRYAQLRRKESKRVANLYLTEWLHDLKVRGIRPDTLAWDHQDIRREAERLVQRHSREISERTAAGDRKRLERYLSRAHAFGIQVSGSVEARAQRLCSPSLMRRKIRKAVNQHREMAALLAGIVGFDGMKHCTDSTIRFREESKKREAAFLADHVILGPDGTWVPLSKVARTAYHRLLAGKIGRRR
jgi:hypothetical protein